MGAGCDVLASDIEPAPLARVLEALADARTYPEWWRPVYLAAERTGRRRSGASRASASRARLPYRLHTTSEIVALERPRRIEGKVEGDLSGLGIWTLTPRDGGTHVRFDWQVNADRPLLRYLTPLLRPLFRWNHNWAIARPRDGLCARRQAAR